MRLSLDKLLTFWGKATPNNIALQDDCRSISYDGLSHAVENMCKYNFSSDTYGLIINDNVDFVVVMLCLMRKRIKFINIGHIVSMNQLAQFLKDNSINAIITDDPEVSNFVSGAIEVSKIKEETSFDSVIVTEQNLNDTVGGFLSSGSTGVPKVYYRDQYSLISEALLWIFELSLSRDKSFYISKPFTYIGSFVLLYAVLYSGGKVVFPKNHQNVHSLPKDKLNFAFFTPLDIRKIIGENTCIQVDNVLTMGAPITQKEKVLLSNLCGCNVYEMWGNSEGLATITNLYENPECSSVGRPTFTDEIFIIDDAGQRLPANNIGTIAGITDNGTICDETTEIIKSEDIGYLDHNNELHLIGRKNNVIIFNDNSYFSTTRLEQELKSRFLITDCAVVLEGRHCFIFVPLCDERKNELEAFLKERYDKYSDEIFINDIISVFEIPYNANGKINYMELKRKIQRC